VKHDDKLVPAQAADKIFLSHAFQEAFGHFLQQPVAGFVSVKIVDRLEPVEIDEQKCALRMTALGSSKQVARILENQGTIR
jgi:hypothetical protein